MRGHAYVMTVTLLFLFPIALALVLLATGEPHRRGKHRNQG